jgi:hypothetical protein
MASLVIVALAGVFVNAHKHVELDEYKELV